jgi:hypothetical protein
MRLPKAVGTLVGGWRGLWCEQNSWEIAFWFQLGCEEGASWESAKAKCGSSAFFEWVALGWREGSGWSCWCSVGLVHSGEWPRREMDGAVFNDCQKAAGEWCHQDIAIDVKSDQHAILALLAINRNSYSTVNQMWQLKTVVCTGNIGSCWVLRRQVFRFDLHPILLAIHRNRIKKTDRNSVHGLTCPKTHLIQLKGNLGVAR